MSRKPDRQIALVAFLQAQNCSTLPAAWRHPDARLDFMSADYYRDLARLLEHGKFDIGFFDDRLAMPDMFGKDHAHTVEHGIRCVKMDPIVTLMAMGMATERLGLGATCSTTYYDPFHVARMFSTLDLMSSGRAAWNVVTSVNENEALNMGRDGVTEHDLRYDRADEFMEVVHGHWDAWDDDALVLDQDNNVFADPDKVHRLDHEGTFFKSRGPFTVPRSAQGHPVVIQAGQSGRGRRFAARWGELIFVAYPTLDAAKPAYKALKDDCAAHGRDPDGMKIASLFYPMVGESLMEAEDKRALYDTLPNETDQLSLLSEALNYDFARKGMDEPFSDEEMEGLTGMQSMRDRAVQVTGNPNPTVRDFMTATGRGLLKDPWVGGPKEVADRMEEFFVERGSDGFVIGATHFHGSFEDLIRHVVPELQKRGLYRKDYTGPTLRDHLGLDYPQPGGWRH